MATSDRTLREYLRHQKHEKQEEQEEEPSWEERTLHGMYHRQSTQPGTECMLSVAWKSQGRNGRRPLG